MTVAAVLPGVDALLAPPSVRPVPEGRLGDPDLRVLFDLTDEELLALDGPDQGVVSLPYLARIGEEAREIARSVALRGLFSRGLLRVAASGTAEAAEASVPGARSYDVEAELAVVLGWRRGPDAVMAAHRLIAGRSGPESLMRYVYLCGEELVIEDVSSSGIHRFAVAAVRLLPALMGEFLSVTAPEGGSAAERVGTGGPGSGGLWPDHLVPGEDGAALLAGAHLLADVVVRRDDAPVGHAQSVYVFPDVAYVGRAPIDDPAAARLSRRDPDGLGEWAAGLLLTGEAPVAT